MISVYVVNSVVEELTVARATRERRALMLKHCNVSVSSVSVWCGEGSAEIFEARRRSEEHKSTSWTRQEAGGLSRFEDGRGGRRK